MKIFYHFTKKFRNKDTSINKLYLSFFVVMLILGNFFAVNISYAADTLDTQHPRLANIYLSTPISRTDAEMLAKWDVVILHMLAQQNSAMNIRYMRMLNPDIIILTYIAAEEFPVTKYKQWDKVPDGLFRRLFAGITDDMWLLDGSGRHVEFWPGNWMLNVTNYSASNERWSEYLADFVVDELLSSGLWDGVFYDNVWIGVSWINGGRVDTDRDGRVDSASLADISWQQGMSNIFDLTRQKAGEDIIIVGNGDRGFYEDINGLYIENFTFDKETRWAEKMQFYAESARKSVNNRIPIIASAPPGGVDMHDYKNMRFGLSSSLLEDGYYAFDAGSNSHAEQWWYDEYNIDLGNPIGDSVSQKGFSSYKPDVWKRDFERGLAVVNSTGNKQVVSLGGEYEKIHGTQDSAINDGSIVTETTVDGYDGLVLLKTFSSLEDILFTNGSFVRFLRPDGERVRNGFFVFEEDKKGNDQIAHIDLDGNGKRDVVVVSGNRIRAWRDDGQPYMKKYPYSASYQGELRVAIGDLNGDKKMEIYVAPQEGYPAPIKIYTRHGRQMKRDWFPFGEGYTGGYSIAVGSINRVKGNELIIGSGSGVKPEVHIFDQFYTHMSQWLAFDSQFRGGISVAAGDVDGDGVDEVIVGAGPGKKPLIRVFNEAGELEYKEFSAYSTFGTPGIEVRTADVDFDGKDDIIGMSNGIGL